MSVHEDLIFSNVKTFYTIARESFCEMKDVDKKCRRPKASGEEGYIISLDPKRRSFKNAFIAIVFCGVCLDSLLHLFIGKYFGQEECKNLDRCIYEDKLVILGCQDYGLLDRLEHFRDARNEVIHEKVYINKGKYRVAQKEAEKAVELLDDICKFFKVKF